jgi:hypothetical protein
MKPKSGPPPKPDPPLMRVLKEGEIPPRLGDKLLQSIEEGTCCPKLFQKEARTGSLDKANNWTCPKCGVEYKPTVINGAVRHWTAQVYSILVRPR